MSITTGDMRPRTSTMQTDRSDFSHQSRRSAPVPGANPNMARSSSIHDLLEQQMQARLQSLVPTLPLGGRGKYAKGGWAWCCNDRRFEGSEKSLVFHLNISLAVNILSRKL